MISLRENPLHIFQFPVLPKWILIICTNVSNVSKCTCQTKNINSVWYIERERKRRKEWQKKKKNKKYLPQSEVVRHKSFWFTIDRLTSACLVLVRIVVEVNTLRWHSREERWLCYLKEEDFFQPSERERKWIKERKEREIERKRKL